MPWIKYDGDDPTTYPQKDGEYRIRRADYSGIAKFSVGKGWAFLIEMPCSWYSEETNFTENRERLSKCFFDIEVLSLKMDKLMDIAEDYPGDISKEDAIKVREYLKEMKVLSDSYFDLFIGMTEL